MKRRFGWVLPVLIALTVVLAAYTIAAAVLLRGLGAYRMGVPDGLDERQAGRISEAQEFKEYDKAPCQIS